MKRLLPSILILAILSVGGWMYFLQPELKFRRVVEKYPRGTPAQKILDDYGGNLKLHKSNNYLGPDPTEEEKRASVGYYLRVPNANAYLFFNHHQELLRIMKETDALRPQ